MMKNTRELGNNIEDIAVGFLEDNDIEVLDRNYRLRSGEIDIIGRDDKELIFIEVKGKTGIGYGYPYEMVTATKKKKLILTAKKYLVENKLPVEGGISWRIDVISVDITTGKIEWFKNAVTQEKQG